MLIYMVYLFEKEGMCRRIQNTLYKTMNEILLLFCLILLNAFFAMTEIAYVSLNDAKIEMMAKSGDKKAIKIKKLLDMPSKFLATIQIGITLAGFLSSAFAADTFADQIAPALMPLL